MKKIYYGILIVALLSSILYSCSLLRALDEVQKNGFICNNYANAPVNLMDRQQVREMLSNYYTHQYKAIHNGPDKVIFPDSLPDSRVVYFDLDTLKRLIYNVDRYTQHLTPAEKANIGLNVYFASYPETHAHFNHGIDYTNRHSVVLVPAYFDTENNMGKGFDPRRVHPNSSIKDAVIKEADLHSGGDMVGVMAVLRRTATNANGDIVSQNHGTAVPPPPSGEPLLDEAD